MWLTNQHMVPKSIFPRSMKCLDSLINELELLEPPLLNIIFSIYMI